LMEHLPLAYDSVHQVTVTCENIVWLAPIKGGWYVHERTDAMPIKP